MDAERPLTEVMKGLAIERLNLQVQKATLDLRRQEWEEDNADLITAVAACARAIVTLEAEVRRRGVTVAEQTRQAPCPGTKVRFERAVRFLKTTEDGEITYMAPDESDTYLVSWAMRHGWTGLVKPNRTACEKVLRKLDESTLPPEVSIEWETKVSIDDDLSDLLKEDTNA